MGVRLEKFLAHYGVASRRVAKQLVIEGRVRINGKPVFIPGRHIDPARDKIEYDGQQVTIRPKHIYLMLHKPAGYITTVEDIEGRKTVMDLVQNIGQRIYPVGRLDKDTEGLLLLTNDGNFSHRILHPSYKLEKTYLAWVEGHPNKREIQKLRTGIWLPTGLTASAAVQEIRRRGVQTHYRIVIHEGKKRQIRQMFQAIGSKVDYLKRIRIGGLSLGKLPIGQFRYLSGDEIRSLKGKS